MVSRGVLPRKLALAFSRTVLVCMCMLLFVAQFIQLYREYNIGPQIVKPYIWQYFNNCRDDLQFLESPNSGRVQIYNTRRCERVFEEGALWRHNKF